MLCVVKLQIRRDGCKNPLSSIMWLSINRTVNYIHVYLCIPNINFSFMYKSKKEASSVKQVFFINCQGHFHYFKDIYVSNEKMEKKVVHLIFDMLLYSIAVQLVCPSVICKRNILGAAWDSSLSFGAATLRIFCICRTHGPSS